MPEPTMRRQTRLRPRDDALHGSQSHTAFATERLYDALTSLLRKPRGPKATWPVGIRAHKDSHFVSTVAPVALLLERNLAS